MSRPTVKTFDDDNLIAQFHSCRANIRGVINLQMLGEHDSCGPKLLASGFTYNPEILMQNGNFGVLGIDILLDIVKVVHYSLRQGNVAIHCHAGLGRTGVVIAAYMVWAKHFTYAEAIGHVRTARPNSVQSKNQIRLVKDFGIFLEKYGAALPRTGLVHLSNYINMQAKILSSNQARKYHHIPKVLHAAMVELLLVVHGELNGWTRRWIANILKCTSRTDPEFLGKRKVKAQEIDIFICGIMENCGKSLDSGRSEAKITKEGAFRMNNCAKFIRTNFRGNILLLLRTLDQLMNSFIKPIIPKEAILDDSRRIGQNAEWQCLNRYLIFTMASLCNGSYKNIAKLLSRWYLGDSANDEDVIASLQQHLQRISSQQL